MEDDFEDYYAIRKVAAAMGRKGGKIGGKIGGKAKTYAKLKACLANIAKANNMLTPEERSKRARRAVMIRWEKAKMRKLMEEAEAAEHTPGETE